MISKMMFIVVSLVPFIMVVQNSNRKERTPFPKKQDLSNRTKYKTFILKPLRKIYDNKLSLCTVYVLQERATMRPKFTMDFLRFGLIHGWFNTLSIHIREIGLGLVRDINKS